MSNRGLVRLIATAGLTSALAACANLPVTVDVNPNLSASMCHNYAFAPTHVPSGGQGAFGNPINAERLRVAVENHLAARGLAKVDLKDADCVVGYAMGSRQVMDQYYGGLGAMWGFGWGWYGGYGYWGGPWGYDGTYVYDETRITVDLFEAKTHKPIWHAYVTESVSDLKGPRADEHINVGVDAIFGKFPIPAPAAAAPAH